MKTLYVKPKDNQKKWFIIDAADKPLGRVALKAAWLLRGKHKPSYVPHHDLGDRVIIINASKALLKGNKLDDKVYYEHSGYSGGMKVMTYKQLLARRPLAPMEKAVKGMLPKGPLGREIFRSLCVFSDSIHPHIGQSPVLVEVK